MTDLEKEKLKKDFINALDSCLESGNADGQIKDCIIDFETNEVIFKFDLHVIEDEYTFIEY